jgi:hypothetical protein
MSGTVANDQIGKPTYTSVPASRHGEDR